MCLFVVDRPEEVATAEKKWTTLLIRKVAFFTLTPKVHFKVYMARAFPGNRSHDGLSYRVGVGPQVGRGGQ